MGLPRSAPEILRLLQEYRFLTPRQLALIRRGRNDVKRIVQVVKTKEGDRERIRRYSNGTRIEQRSLNLLFQAGKAKRLPYYDLRNESGFGGRSFVYHLSEEHSRRTLDHELDITDYHIRVKSFCGANGIDLIWQQKHMAGRFWPDAYFSLRGLHFFLEIERQEYGNVRNGKPSIVRKAEAYYEYYDSADCLHRWGFNRFRVIFQLRRIRPDDFLSRIPNHRLFWIGTPDTLTYKTPNDPERVFGFLDV